MNFKVLSSSNNSMIIFHPFPFYFSIMSQQLILLILCVPVILPLFSVCTSDHIQETVETKFCCVSMYFCSSFVRHAQGSKQSKPLAVQFQDAEFHVGSGFPKLFVKIFQGDRKQHFLDRKATTLTKSQLLAPKHRQYTVSQRECCQGCFNIATQCIFSNLFLEMAKLFWLKLSGKKKLKKIIIIIKRAPSHLMVKFSLRG